MWTEILNLERNQWKFVVWGKLKKWKYWPDWASCPSACFWPGRFFSCPALRCLVSSGLVSCYLGKECSGHPASRHNTKKKKKTVKKWETVQSSENLVTDFWKECRALLVSYDLHIIYSHLVFVQMTCYKSIVCEKAVCIIILIIFKQLK